MLISTNNRAFQNKSLGVKISEFDAFFTGIKFGLVSTAKLLRILAGQ